MKTTMKPAWNPSSIRFIVLLAVIILISRQAVTVGAVTCNPQELLPCLSAFKSPTPPSGQCCAKLREQSPCLCEYIRTPALAPYVSSPNAKKVAQSCGVPVPSC